ncbi:V-type proton ATPase catalytic subunit A [Carex littledalei]|uniref:V-type proton ATPase catalytic subunit A n=1 Tax=Carex littledalei TaxID=544730 RepID=A0A833VGT0_9POAL|nr:V-type proton ATPase catalytic subunit A [Carex littledalei]
MKVRACMYDGGKLHMKVPVPVVFVDGIGGAAMYGLVHFSYDNLIGEIIRLEGDCATIQVPSTDMSLYNEGVKGNDPKIWHSQSCGYGPSKGKFTRSLLIPNTFVHDVMSHQSSGDGKPSLSKKRRCATCKGLSVSSSIQSRLRLILCLQLVVLVFVLEAD